MELIKQLQSEKILPVNNKEGMVSGKPGGSKTPDIRATAPLTSLYEQVMEAHGLPIPDSKSLINGKSGGSTELKDKKYPSSVLTSIGILFISDRKEPKSNPETQTASIDSTSDISSKYAMTYTLTNHTYTAQRLDDSYSDDTQADS